MPRIRCATYFPPGVGASGAVFGIAGALIILLKSHRLPVPHRGSEATAQVGNLFCGDQPRDRRRHHFGLTFHRHGHSHRQLRRTWAAWLCGLLFAAPMVPRLGAPTHALRTRLRIAVVMTVTILVLFGFYPRAVAEIAAAHAASASPVQQ